jgi:hypothetical protein
MSIRHKAFAWILFVQLGVGLLVSLPANGPGADGLRRIGRDVQQPAAMGVVNVAEALGVEKPSEGVVWPAVLSLCVVPLNIVIWCALLQVVAERIEFAQRNSAGARHLRQ